MVSLVASFYDVRFPRDVLSEIWDLIESVSEGFPSYSSLYKFTIFCKADTDNTTFSDRCFMYNV